MTQVAGEGNNRQKICRVCSDKAMGFNFNAITCESCKAFFRRNAFKGEKLRCPFNNDCIIDKSTRRFCQKCRLEKCLLVGMKREWILSEEQKKIKRAKIAENRMKRTEGSPEMQKEDKPNSSNENKKDYTGGPSTPSSNFSISCSSSNSSQFGDDNGTSQCFYNLVPSPLHESAVRKDPMIQSGLNSTPLTSKLLDHNLSLTSNKIPAPSGSDHFEATSSERYEALRSATAASLLLDKDLLHNNWVSLITNPSSNPSVITRKPNLSTSVPDSLNSVINCHGNLENMANFCRSPTSLLMSNTLSYEQPKSQSEPSPDNNRDYDEREESWKIKVNHRILEANFAPIYLRSGTDGPGTLNDLETAKINELVQAFSVIDEPILDQSCAEDSGISDVIRFSDLAIRRLIKWCKKIQAFASLCLEDQMALLKAGCLEMLSMKASYNFNLDDESWQDTYTKHGLKLTIFRQASEKLYQAHRQFIRTFNQRWRTDHKVNLLLVAIVLFNPDRPNLLHMATVRLEHYTYIYLLRRYLETKSDSLCQARTDHYELMMKIEDLRELHEKTVRLYSDAGPEVVGPLLIEILDLK